MPEILIADLVKDVVIWGLRLSISELTTAEVQAQANAIDDLLDEGHTREQIRDAIRHGMDNVWPFSKGQTWDGNDLRRNFTKAKAEAARKRRMGMVPWTQEDLSE